MTVHCEFCGAEIKGSFCKCDESMSSVYHMINMINCLNHCDRMLKIVDENDGKDLTEEQAEKIIEMCIEEKKKIKIELANLLDEVDDGSVQ